MNRTILTNYHYERELMRKTGHTANIGGIIGFCLSIVLVYVILLAPVKESFSVSALMQYAANCSNNAQMLMVVLIPIYFAIVIFGGSALGFYLGKTLQNGLKASKKA